MTKNHGLWIALFSLWSTAVAAQTIAVAEINFNSDSTTTSGDWFELYNYGTSSVSLANWVFRDGNNQNQFVFPPTLQLAAGARIVVVNDSQKFKSRHPFVTNFFGSFNFGLGNNGDQIRLYDAQGNLVVFIEYADSLPWHPAADGTGRTLELRSVTLNPNDPNSWFVGCMFGSPGMPFAPCYDQIIFSEINYNPNPLFNAGEWVELYNRGPSYVNLSGWSFKDSKEGNAFYLPANLHLPPQSRLVLVGDTTLFDAMHPHVTNRIGNFDFNLSNDGELIRLFDYSGTLRFSMVYNDAGDWPKTPDGGGYTLEFSDTTWNVNNPLAWFAGCVGGSPGYAYDPDCLTGITDEPQPLAQLTVVEGMLLITVPMGPPALLRLYSVEGHLLDAETLNPGQHRRPLRPMTLTPLLCTLIHPSGVITKKLIH
ncbi:MAG: lamin tail domain-containing protein [Chitinophagales bacterium]|nr:lamin tail domain-containing protein [Chitinophagales bacterium]MDW8427410.1 lamin tail domain-containing protein [Chitinophagales bacterium]